MFDNKTWEVIFQHKNGALHFWRYTGQHWRRSLMLCRMGNGPLFKCGRWFAHGASDKT